MAASFYIIFSISVTKEYKSFNNFFEKHIKIRSLTNKLVNLLASCIYKLPQLALYLGEIFIGNASKEQWNEYKININKLVKEFDENSLIVKILIIPCFIMIVWISLICFSNITEEMSEWIGAILNFVVSLISLPFLFSSVKEYAIEKENN